jgi:AcrR family transcriptional regulator
VTKRSQKSIGLLVKSACYLFSRYGNRNFTVTELCEHAKISRRTFYRHFENIEDVLDRGIEQQWLQFRSAVKGPEAKKSLSVSVESLRRAVEQVREDPDFYASLLRGKFNGTPRIIDFAIDMTKQKADTLPNFTLLDEYLSSGVILAFLFFILDHHLDNQFNPDEVVENTLNYVRRAAGLIPRSLSAMERTL